MRGYTDNKQDLQRRLRRIEGQVRGLQRMVDEDAYCIDVLTQISAATKALQSVAVEMLDDHLGHCVREAIASGGPDAEAARVFDIDWEVAEATFRLRWAERGGPEVVKPTRTGFGSRLIQRTLGPQLGGQVTTDFDPDGLVCTLEVPLISVQERAGPDEADVP